jgi:hypothetical protein
MRKVICPFCGSDDIEWQGDEFADCMGCGQEFRFSEPVDEPVDADEPPVLGPPETDRRL